MREDGPAKLNIEIKYDWLLIRFTFITKSPGCCGRSNELCFWRNRSLCHFNVIEYTGEWIESLASSSILQGPKFHSQNFTFQTCFCYNHTLLCLEN